MKRSQRSHKKLFNGLSTVMMIWRLSLGANLNPLYWRYNFSKMFPAPRVVRFKEYMTRYFIYN